MAKTMNTKATRTRVGGKTVEIIRHTGDKRKNIPSAEHQSVLEKTEAAPRPVKYPRNTDLDPQLVWRGKDEQDWTDLVVQAPPLYIQERVHPKVLVDDLLRQSRQTQEQAPGAQFDLFGDFNGIPESVDRTEFYQHDQNWSNRMILGDSLQVMASLAEREGLRGKVQCIYIDPPYGIKFNSNFQWSTTSRDVKDGKVGHITREPEQVKAFRDTWRDGLHSYMTYLRDRLTVARDLLTESGSVFVQIGDENVHRVRALMDETVGEDNFVAEIHFSTTSGFNSEFLASTGDMLLWYAKNRASLKFRRPYEVIEKSATAGNYMWLTEEGRLRSLTAREKRGDTTLPNDARLYQPTSLVSQGATSSPWPCLRIKARCTGRHRINTGRQRNRECGVWPGPGGFTWRRIAFATCAWRMISVSRLGQHRGPTLQRVTSRRKNCTSFKLPRRWSSGACLWRLILAILCSIQPVVQERWQSWPSSGDGVGSP